MQCNKSAAVVAAALLWVVGVSAGRIDESVRRILTLKFELGLFDHPLVDPSKADAAITGNQDVARQAADESITLLRNQGGALPLSPSARVVVTGPNADALVVDQPGLARALERRLDALGVRHERTDVDGFTILHRFSRRVALEELSGYDTEERHEGGDQDERVEDTTN